MKRMHFHLGVADLAESVAFYSRLFGVEPTVLEADYAKWRLDAPLVNFAISTRSGRVGLDHLGIQVDDADELKAVRNAFAEADANVSDEPGTTCCYTQSDKHWITDPQGIPWEAFHTLASVPTFGGKAQDGGCCAPMPLSQIAEPETRCAPGSDCC
ncbi:ArsI/CadI family heavy metal resistance metalloenzyme [Chitinibacteraceae bacterium HSL-7]